MDRQAQTKLNILNAVLLCKRENIDEEPQLTQIAAKAGVSVRTLSRYYPNKEELFGLAYMHFLQQKYDRAIKDFRAADFSGLSGYEQLLRFLDSSSVAHESDTAEAVITAFAYINCVQFGMKNTAAFHDASDRGRALIKQILTLGRQDGSVNKTLDLAVTVDLIEAGFNGLMQKIAMDHQINLDKPGNCRALTLIGEFLKMLRWYLAPGS